MLAITYKLMLFLFTDMNHSSSRITSPIVVRIKTVMLISNGLDNVLDNF